MTEQWIRQPRQPNAHIQHAHSLGRGMLTFEQIEELVKPINQAYVEKKQNMTYLAQHQARAEMNRIFGYGNWDSDVEEMTLMYEEQRPGTGAKANKTYWIVGYRAKVRVNIRDLWGMPVASFAEHHAEENAPQPNRGEAHALALTSVESYALRRALIGLGDRFGLGLYNAGSVAPHGQYTAQLQSGILFDWTQAGAAPLPPASAPQQPTHETIQAEPAVASPEYHAAGDEQQQQQQQPSGSMDEFRQVQQQMQASREQQRMSQGMQSRLQNGLKHDGMQEGGA